jgi:MFS family permease
MTTRPRPWLALVILGGYGASVAVGALLYHLNHSAQRDLSGAVSNLVAYTTFTVMGSLIIARRPGQVIGWLFCAIGLSATLSVLAEEYAKYALVTSPESLALGLAAAWASNWLWVPSVLLPTSFLLLLFPDGQLPSRRWRPLAWLAATVIATGMLAIALVPGPLDSLPRVANPLGVDLLGDALDGVLAAVGPLYLIVTATCVAAVIVRFRRSRGDERQQLKWFAYAAALILVFLLLNVLAGGPNNLFLGVGLTLFPLATGIAVLRYRLYDIDRLINRTLVYATLTAVLGLGYAASVLVMGQLFGRDRSSLAVAAATLTIAALFQPLRRRVQQAVDRRFNRRKYNAAKTIEAFSARLREEIDLDSLSNELLMVVHQTMEPTTVSLWLRPPPQGAGARLARRQGPPTEPIRSG